jgi:hypothetical protein
MRLRASPANTEFKEKVRAKKKLIAVFVLLTKSRIDTSCNYNRINLFYPPGSNPDVTGHSTFGRTLPSGCPLSIEFRAQLLLVDSPLPTFFCAIDCSVFVSDSSASTCGVMAA